MRTAGAWRPTDHEAELPDNTRQGRGADVLVTTGGPQSDTVAGADGDPAGLAASGSALWLRALRYSLLVYVGVCLGLAVLALLTVAVLPAQHGASVPGWPAPALVSGWRNAVTGWVHWDAPWFLRIASEGYRVDDNSAAFFPLYPLLVRAVGVVTGDHWLLAGLLVANLALVAALALLYVLTAGELGEGLARRAVLYLAVFPTSFFLASPYSESTFLALVVAALYAARRRRWLLAGLLGAGAALTRSVGVVLVVALSLEALAAVRGDRSAGRLRVGPAVGRLAAATLPLAGLAAYFAFWQLTDGRWDAPLDAQKAWQREFSWPWHSLIQGTRLGLDLVGDPGGGYFTIDLLLVAVALVAAVWVTRRCRPSYTAYTWTSLLIPLFLIFEPRPFMSQPRFLVVIFPLFWALARFGERWRAHDLVVGVSAGGLALLGALFFLNYPIF